MTQLIIDGREAVLPKNFQATVKRENSFFTKNGEYTYDCTLRMDNPVNQELYGFLHRLNKTEQVETNRTAVLIADGHVYCRGTEIVTRWTEQTVTIQIVSGESELNYFIGQDRKIETLDLGTADATNSVYPVVRTKAGGLMNYQRKFKYERHVFITLTRTFEGGEYIKRVPSPLLCPLIEKIVEALGYTVTRNDLKESMFGQLFLLNCRDTSSPAKMLEGWTVKDLLSEIENLTGVVFVTDNANRTCDIVRKTIFYMTATQFTVRNVVDAYEAEVADDEGRDAEFSTSDVSYDLPDGRWAKLMKLPDGLPTTMTVRDCASLSYMRSVAQAINIASPILLRHTSTDRLYVASQYTVRPAEGDETTGVRLCEVDQFCDLDREDTDSELELKITPAPMAYLGWPNDTEIIDLGTTDGYDGREVGYTEWINFEDYDPEGDEEVWEETEDDMVEPKDTFEETIRAAEKKEASASDLYCAFWGGYTSGGNPIVYTDGYHANMLQLTAGGNIKISDFDNLTGSLRLKDLDTDYFQGGYEIDTRHAMTFETYDPNVIDTRQVYVIRNKRFVVRDVEETITADGRAKKWKLTCYPITVSDDALEKRWVLTHGVWDDGAAWLDDGRWNDLNEE